MTELLQAFDHRGVFVSLNYYSHTGRRRNAVLPKLQAQTRFLPLPILSGLSPRNASPKRTYGGVSDASIDLPLSSGVHASASAFSFGCIARPAH